MIRVLLSAALLLLPTALLHAGGDTQPGNLRVLMTVGGVGYNTTIVRMLRADTKMSLTVRDSDEQSPFTEGVLNDFDAILMYHRDNIAEPEERRALVQFLEHGGGIVVLHHAIANYPDWPEWWREHVGGLYVLSDHEDLEPSRYFADFRGVARPSGAHPVTKGIGDFWRYTDESYSNLWISDEIDPLLITTAFGADRPLAWIGPAPSQRVLFIQPGHGETVLSDPKYLTLIGNALRWSARIEK